jgi:crotonobetaine/carnitine-CoA ligase
MITVDPMPVGPFTADPRVPPREAVVTRMVLERLAREKGDEPFVVFDDDLETWSYADLHQKTVQTALGLQQLGVRMGDHVLVWLDNSRENLRFFFALGIVVAVLRRSSIRRVVFAADLTRNC